MSKIIQLLPVTSPLTIEFPRVSENEYKPFSVSVEFIALVDYDGEREIEYGAILDGQMMLFNVDGNQVVLRKGVVFKRFANITFKDEVNKSIRKMNGGSSYV